jgi:tRNA (guanine37-N1)-methyltransferase
LILEKGYEIVDLTPEVFEKAKPVKELLEEKLSQEEMSMLKTAHDVVGSIAIIEVPEQLEKKEGLIAESILESHKNIKTVVKKAGFHEGIFRTQKMKHLAGQKTKQTLHKENKIKLKIDIEKVYFSARLSTERKRISELVKSDEKILVMFSGCAPYPCVLSKNTPAKEIVGIEINPYGHKFGIENVELNRLSNVRLYMGDVRKIIPKLNEKFDRIVMPLPHTAEEFLSAAFQAAKDKTIIHLYDFLDEEDIPEKAVDKIGKACEENDIKFKVIRVVKCGQFSPRKFRICTDFQIYKD